MKKGIPMRSLCWLMVIIYGTCLEVFSQVSGQTVTGTVTDENQESLPGVNVVVKGTTKRY